MAILSYNEITIKKVIVHEGDPCLVIDSHVFRKQKRKPVNNTKLKNLKNGRLLDVTFHVSETAEEAELETKSVTFIYRKPGEYWFHFTGNPSERFELGEELVGDQGRFLKERSDVDALVFDDEIIGLKLPIKMDLKVKEAAPAVKGNTSSGALKQVTLETGATIMVPMFINEGDVICVNTEAGEYSSRAEKN